MLPQEKDFEKTDAVFQYLRDEKNHPLVTICYMKESGFFSKGVAVCSNKDNFNKSEGRMRSLNRAKKAFKLKSAKSVSLPTELGEKINSTLDKTSFNEHFLGESSKFTFAKFSFNVKIGGNK